MRILVSSYLLHVNSSEAHQMVNEEKETPIKFNLKAADETLDQFF